MARTKALIRWSSALVLVLLLIMVPFFLWEESLRGWSEGKLKTFWSPWAVGVLLATLLAGDLVLPVPSSVLSTASGALLGFWLGTFVTWVGMTTGCWIGYVLGAGPGRKATQQLVGTKEIARIATLHTHIGDLVVVVFRAVPVLAEVSVIFAGVAGISAKRFLLLVGLANAGIAIVYAAIGAFALTTESFLPALVGAVGVPALVMFGLWLRR